MNGDSDSSPENDGQMQDESTWFDNCLSPAASNLSFMLTSPCASRLTPTHGDMGIGTPLSDNHMLKNDAFATHFSPSIFSPSKKTSKIVKKRNTASSSSSSTTAARARNTSSRNSKKGFQSEQFPIL